MNTYSFPLGTDHDDYDATRVAADLRAQRGSARATGSSRSRRPHLADLLGFTTGRAASRGHRVAR